MKIKSLQMQGFKSFGDRTELHFNEQIVGVVGPNGCGKSNIVDAIRWAMGEQSAKGLRGSEMMDVIFNGTSSRKKASFAEVSLVFDNAEKLAPAPYTDCSEVMITRRLFRSGESEYLINKVGVRLKDINDLFLGSGSSTRAYSIVAQGKVDQIVLAKPEDRRMLLEEAAGVAKYKVRKSAAERKMEATKLNLERVADIVQELERSARHLERQVGRAEQFRKIQTELRKLDEQIIAAKVTQLDRLASKNAESRATSSADFESVSTQLSQLEAEIEKFRLEALHQEKLSSSDYESLISLKERFLNSDKEKELSQQRIASLKHQVAEREKDIERIRSKEVENESAMNQVIVDRERLQTERDSKKSELDTLKSTLTSAEEKIKSLDIENIQLQKKLDEQKTIFAKESQKREIYLSERVTLELRRVEIEQEKENLEREFLRFTILESQKKTEHAELSTQIQNLETEWKNLQEKHAELIRSQTAFFEERSQAQELLSQCESEIKSLQTLEDHEVGYDLGALEHRKLTGEPLLMDSVRFKTGSEKMAEAFFSEFGQCFTKGSSTEEVGARWSYLFASSKSSALSNSLLNYVEGSTTEEIAAILSTVAVVDSLSSNPVSHAEITPKGEFRLAISSQLFLQSQGQVLAKESPFGRRSELAKFEAEKIELSSKVDQLDEKIAELKTIQEDTSRQMGVLHSQIKEQSLQLSKSQIEISKVQSQFELVKSQIQSSDVEMQEIDQKLLELGEKIQKASGFAIEAELEQSQFQLAEQLQLAREQKSLLDSRWIEERISFGAVEERLERLIQQSSKAEMTQSEYSHNQNIYKSDIESWTSEIAKEEGRIQSFLATKESDETEISSIERRLAENKQSLNSIRSQVEQSEVSRKDVQKSKDSLQASVQELELEHQRLKFEVEELSQIVNERYHISLQDVLAQVTEADLEKLEDQTVLQAYEVEAKELREKLEKFGEVNLLALTEFEEITQRLQFMNKQREDLLQTLDSLQSIIDRINKITEFRFRETFKAINHNFQILFPKLFGGGRAYMSLTNEQDLLETGIEIFAEPPGKKVQTMSLLSGGEKAMTSISLIFSLFAYRPSSFCILDEVDAPLDEINTVRYNGIIEEMASLSQFIVITHNKRTMEVADTLFGVTMQEPGVSQLVGVQLNEAKAFVGSSPAA
ncbi:MAG: chromosome segregation protein SMC [Deltaproteobacteria bacterium]|nr:chromosome segregation protein SMC [Deltaproteobacteria bacterium]